MNISSIVANSLLELQKGPGKRKAAAIEDPCLIEAASRAPRASRSKARTALAAGVLAKARGEG